ncbi:MAG: hypothetical protein GY757_17820 [bacterium]|nr:hypothetical protein [bacterium]
MNEFSPEPVKIYIYPNRMEITSYPGPLQGIKKEHLENGTPPALPLRNRRIGDFLKELRLAEARGTGIPKILQAMKDNGSPTPVFDFDEDRTYFRVTLPIHEKYRELSSGKPPEQRQWTARDNNYIFIFGNPGVGKSTILAGLSKALFDNYLVFMNPKKNVSNRVLQELLQDINDSQLPSSSLSGKVFDIEIGIENLKEQKKSTNLNFLEASGDNLEKLAYMQEGNCARELTEYLRKAGIFLVVTSFEEAAYDDLLIWSFFNRLKNEGIDMSKLVLIISKWDLNTEGLKINTFVKKKMPQTYKWLSFLSWGKMNLLPFSIGKVENNELKSLELKDSRLLVERLLSWVLPPV